MNPKISVLIPVYRVEPYLERCIESVLAQDFVDYELILVDDGSPDRCPAICDDYAARYDFIHVVHKENGGLLSARKAGVEVARGEYCVFWDSDDYAPADALSKLYGAITSGEGYDVVRASARRVDSEGREWEMEPYPFRGEIIGTQEYLRLQFSGQLSPYLWCNIYRTELFTPEVYESSLFFGISVGEDWVTNLVVGTHVKRALVIDAVVYFYFVNEASMMTQCVFSYDYQDQVGAVLLETGVSDLLDDEDLVEYKSACDIARKCFVPEIPFSLERYGWLRNFVRRENGMALLKKKVDRKFLFLVRCLPLYYLYSRLYCLLYKWCKLKGKSRRVL